MKSFNVWTVVALLVAASLYWGGDGIGTAVGVFVVLMILPFVWEEAKKPGNP